jgi:hypothetical protein
MNVYKAAQALTRASSYKMHNLYFVTVFEDCRVPFGASDYAAIQLDGESRRR